MTKTYKIYLLLYIPLLTHIPIIAAMRNAAQATIPVAKTVITNSMPDAATFLRASQSFAKNTSLAVGQTTLRPIGMKTFSSSGKSLYAPKIEQYLNQKGLEFDQNLDTFKAEEIDPFMKKNIEPALDSFKDQSLQFKSKVFELWNILQDEPTTLVLANPTSSPTAVAPKLSRNETITAIKAVTDKIFDANDQRSLSAYIQDIKELTNNLDPIEDKKIIDAVTFIQANQHRTSIIWDSGFWMKAAQEQNLTEIPVSPAVLAIPTSTMINVANQKIAIKPAD